MNMINTADNSSEEMINKLQELKGKTKQKFHKIVSNYHDEMNIKNFQFQQDSFSKNAQSISKIYHEVFLLNNFYRLKLKLKT